MGKKMVSSRWRGAFVASACVILVGGVSAGLYFGLSTVKEPVDSAFEALGSVTLVDMVAWDSEQPSTWPAYVSGIAYDTVNHRMYTEKAGVSSMVTPIVSKWQGLQGEDAVPFAAGVVGDSTGNAVIALQGSHEAGTSAAEDKLWFVLNCPVAETAFDSIYLYDLSPLGDYSVKKLKGVFSVLVTSAGALDGDLTFKKADVLKAADSWDAAPASSSSAS